jgi:glycosyltransferase involved in cell wall biosynthesis
LRNIVVRRLWWTFPAARRAARRGLVVVCNDETEALARRLGARAVLRDVDVGLPADRFVKPTSCRREGRPLHLIWAGRLFPRKAVDLAVEAVAGTRHPVTLDVVGDGPRMPALRDLVEKLGLRDRVTLHGMVPVDDVAPLLRGADVLVFTSARDTTGLQLLEGMALGLPVVCLDHQGARRLVTDAAGIRVPIGEWGVMARDMAAAVDRLADDPRLRRRMGAAAHERSLREEWGRKAERTIGWYEAALADRRSPP